MKKELTLLVVLASATIVKAQPSIPVDPLTGKANITIPIGQVQEGDLSAPVALVYSGGGVRVEETEGTAGMSWNLISGGNVSRDVRGLPDDYIGTGTDNRRGWLFDNMATQINGFNSTADMDAATCYEEGADYTFLNGLSQLKDTEPDVFYFSAPGLSGQFVLGIDGLPKLMPYQDLKVELIRPNGNAITQLKITNNIGVVYFFNTAESVTRDASSVNPGAITAFRSAWLQYQEPATFNTSWHLTQITSPSGAEITFSYTQENDELPSVNPVIVVDAAGTARELYAIKDSRKPYRLTSIVTDAVSALLTWDQSRVSEIIISDTHFAIQKQFQFIYEGIRDYRAAGFDVDRYFLRELQEVQTSNCSAFPSYKFSYRGVDFTARTNWIPFYTRNLQDHWGYYNEQSASKIPAVYVYNSQTGAERFRLKPLAATPDQTLTGADRSANPSVVDAGSLTEIMYPTGSSAFITYQSNSYFDPIANDSVQGGGVRVASVQITGIEKGSEKIKTTYTYKMADGRTSGQTLYRPVYAFADGSSIVRTVDNQASEGGVMYGRVTVRQEGRGSTVYEYVLPGMYLAAAGNDWQATPTKIARTPVTPPTACPAVGNQNGGNYTYPFAPNTNFDFERGLVNKIQDYAQNGTLVRERTYGYARLVTTQLKVKGLRFETFMSNFIFSPYYLITNVGKVMVTETTRVADEVNPANMIETASTYLYSTTHQMLESVSVTNGDGVMTRTEFRYAKNFNITGTPTQLEAIAVKGLNASNQHGRLLETYTIRQIGLNPGSVTGASLTLYREFPSGSGRFLPYQSLSFPAQSGFTTTTLTAGQNLAWNPNYIITSTIDSYNPIGLPVSTHDEKKNKGGVHYGFSNTIPVATVANALTEETVYDGFETAGTATLTGTGPLVPGWTGRYAKSLAAGVVLSKAVVNKGANKYRFSAWIKGASAANLTFRLAQAPAYNGVLAYTGSGTWQYVEGTMDITGYGATTFTLELVGSANVELDDVRFFPQGASMATTTVDPMVGVTSASDDRGVSVFKEYDQQGRLTYVKDRNKNVVQVNEYAYQRTISVPLESTFTNNAPDRLIVGTTVAFTASGQNCVPVSYSWKVNNVSVGGNSPTLSYTFNTSGYTQVSLTVSSAGVTSTTTSGFSSFCIEPAPGTVRLAPQGGDAALDIWWCSGDFVRTVTATALANGCASVQNESYTWYYRTLTSNDWLPASGGGTANQLIFNIQTQSGVLQSYILKCVYTGSCMVTTGMPGCQGEYPYTAEQTISFTYHFQSQCQ